MKTTINAILTALLLASAAALNAGEPPKPKPASKEFERIKSLAGSWKGTVDMGQGQMEMAVEYRVVSGGSAVEERVFAGTPKEMVTMYHDRKGQLSLTHYCMLANQPGMRLKSSDAKKLTFDFDPTCGVDGKTEMHMHSLTLTFADADTLVQDWQLFESGKAKDNHPFTLKRVK